MTDEPDRSNLLIFPSGTRVVILRPVVGESGRILHPGGTTGLIVRSPVDLDHAYRVRFADGTQESMLRHEVVMLSQRHAQSNQNDSMSDADRSLFDRVIFRCVIGSRAYGLDDEQSDTDYRGIYLPCAADHWSLTGVPDQIERHETQEFYWELQRFLVLALKANPNILECLYSPIVEFASPFAQKLLNQRSIFLSKVVYQTFSNYVQSQFAKIQADVRNQGQIKWKHVMHLLRLLLSGTTVLQEGFVSVRVDAYREQLLAIKRGEVSWEEADRWRSSLQTDFERAAAQTSLPECPDYASANALLLEARLAATSKVLP